MLLTSDRSETEKCQFFEKDDIIYLVYGMFPDKKGKWILEQMAKHYSELVRNKNVDNLSKIEKYEIERSFEGRVRFILKEFITLQEVFTDQEIPYVENKVRLDYVGLSSMSIGVISLLLGADKLNFDDLSGYEGEELKEMQESLLTAKIEAIAANTLGNTGAYPRWIAVKLGFQNYRFLTFKRYQNDYFLSILSEGNLKKIEKAEETLDPYINHVIDEPFTGNLKPFNRLKGTIKDLLQKNREFL